MTNTIFVGEHKGSPFLPPSECYLFYKAVLLVTSQFCDKTLCSSSELKFCQGLPCFQSLRNCRIKDQSSIRIDSCLFCRIGYVKEPKKGDSLCTSINLFIANLLTGFACKCERLKLNISLYIPIIKVIKPQQGYSLH